MSTSQTCIRKQVSSRAPPRCGVALTPGKNFVDTLFDDDATTPITAGSALITGSFQPESSLFGI